MSIGYKGAEQFVCKSGDLLLTRRRQSLRRAGSYWYDASGERVIKTGGDDEGIFVNDVFSGARTETTNFTAYINPYLVVSRGGSYTKHIYIGSQRIVSKLGDLDSYGSDPRRIEYAGANVDGASVNYQAKYAASQQQLKDNYAVFKVPYYGTDNNDYVNGTGFCCNDSPNKSSAFRAGMANDNPELFQYYYHSDHLGSTSLITDLDGNVVQHVEYVPYGEVFIEERNNTWNTPYLFNAKELDEETGLYYYGARYYDPRVSNWLSADPLQEKYPGITTYCYTAANPVMFVDTDGKKIYFIGGANNDADGWNYIGRFNRIWTKLGLKDFTRVNATNGKAGDMMFSSDYRNSQTATHFTPGGMFGGSVPYETKATDNEAYKKALTGIIANLQTNPLQKGEQLNLAGYSYGAVMQEHLAIGLVENGYKIDNLILIGSPTSDNSSLMDKLNGLVDEGKIGKIIRHDIPGDYLSNPKDQRTFLKGVIQSSPIVGKGDNAPHFDLARPGEEADKKIECLGNKLIENGVK